MALPTLRPLPRISARLFQARTFQPTTRALSTTISRCQIKEDKEQTPEEAESEKRESLRKQQEGKGHWHEELASQTESHVKADREDVEDHGEHIGDLQKETAQQREEGKL